MSVQKKSGDTVVSKLRENAAKLGKDHVVFINTEINGKEKKRYTYGQLIQRSEGVARALLKHNVKLDDRIALVMIPGTLDVCIAFFACSMVGAIPVCVFPPDPRRLERDIPKFERTVNDCDAKIILTNNEYYRLAFRPFSGAKWPKNLTWLKVNEYKKPSKNQPPFSDQPQSNIAFLQYTSGSTSAPKGCIITQSAVLENCQGLVKAYGWTPQCTISSWAPHFHDMALIGLILSPCVLGGTGLMLSPLLFMASPLVWLQVVSRYKADFVATPAFGLVLAVRKTTAKDREALDLSKTKFIVGAEPVRVNVVDKFVKTFNLSPKNITPSYGLAEHVLLFMCQKTSDVHITLDRDAFEQDKIVVVPNEYANDSSKRVIQFLSSGQPVFDTWDLKVVDPEKHTVCGEDVVGEAWVSSLSRASGYWAQPELSAEAFGAKLADGGMGITGDGYYRTGDYGFLHDGHFFLCGRKKDLIIIGGRNFYPQDIELEIESVEHVRPGCVIAFEVELGEDQLQSIVIVCEVRDPKKMKQADLETMASAVYRNVMSNFQIQPHAVVILSDHKIPKTTSGKVQRQPAKKMWQSNTLAGVLYTKTWENTETKMLPSLTIPKTTTPVVEPTSDPATDSNTTTTPVTETTTVDANAAAEVNSESATEEEESGSNADPAESAESEIGEIDPFVVKVLEEALEEVIEGEFEDDTELFEVGLSSLIGTQLLNNVNDRLGTNVHVAELYSQPTILHLKSCISKHYREKQQADNKTENTTEAEVDIPAVRNNGADESQPQPAKVKPLWLKIVEDEIEFDEDVSDDDELADFGISSLIATQIVQRINDETGSDIAPAEFFMCRTVGDLNKLFSQNTTTSTSTDTAQV